MKKNGCDGYTCKQHKATRQPDHSWYDREGLVKRCNHCAIFINWEGNSCPCCNYRLASSPRNKNKWRLRNEPIQQA